MTRMKKLACSVSLILVGAAPVAANTRADAPKSLRMRARPRRRSHKPPRRPISHLLVMRPCRGQHPPPAPVPDQAPARLLRSLRRRRHRHAGAARRDADRRGARQARRARGEDRGHHGHRLADRPQGGRLAVAGLRRRPREARQRRHHQRRRHPAEGPGAGQRDQRAEQQRRRRLDPHQPAKPRHAAHAGAAERAPRGGERPRRRRLGRHRDDPAGDDRARRGAEGWRVGGLRLGRRRRRGQHHHAHQLQRHRRHRVHRRPRRRATAPTTISAS